MDTVFPGGEKSYNAEICAISTKIFADLQKTADKKDLIWGKTKLFRGKSRKITPDFLIDITRKREESFIGYSQENACNFAPSNLHTPKIRLERREFSTLSTGLSTGGGDGGKIILYTF